MCSFFQTCHGEAIAIACLLGILRRVIAIATWSKSDIEQLTIGVESERAEYRIAFLDNDDIPTYDKNNYQKYVFSGHRYQKKYVSKDGTVINADLNGSANTLRKAFPAAFDNGIRPDFTNTLIYKHPDMKPYRCAA